MKRSGNNGATTATLHWRAPAVMLSSLLVGVALAIGHHAFYASLAGTAVSSDPIKVVGWTTTQQQVNVAVGTAFAFVVKASLILACSTAYMQLLFGAINRRSFQISQLDNWFGGLNDFWSLLCVGTYWRYPLLTLGALTCWLLPIAAIISPASLSVVFDRIHPSPVWNTFVPLPAFDSLAFGIFGANGVEGGQQLTYRGPVEEVSRIALASAAQGVILPIEPPRTNTTWQSTITAPRLGCDVIDPYVQEDIKDNLIDLFNNLTNNRDYGTWTTIMFNYISWTAYSDDVWPMPFKEDGSSGWQIQGLDTGRQPYSSNIGIDTFFAILPRASLDLPWENHGLKMRPGYEERKDPAAIAINKMTLMDWLWEDSTMLHCRFVPTDFTLNFTYSGVDQTQEINVVERKDSVLPDFNSTVLQAHGPNYTFVSEDLSTATVLVGGGFAKPVAATGSGSSPTQVSTPNVVVGGAVTGSTSSTHSTRPRTIIPLPMVTARSTPPDRALRLKSLTESNIDVSNITDLARHSLKLSSWSAVQEAAMVLWVGASNRYSSKPGWAQIPWGFGGAIGSMDFSTRIFATAMADSHELSVLSRKAPTADQIADESSGLAYDQAAGLLANITTTQSKRPFKDMIEELFLNVTLSMASSKSLVYQRTSPLAPPATQVTQEVFGNVYSYALDKLWLAYGIAIGVCIINIVIGLGSVVRSGASFTGNFSTIVRIGHNASIEVDMYEQGLPGSDPLPKAIADAELCTRKEGSPLTIKHNGLLTVIERRGSSDTTS